jgi:hypothetical protein
VAAAAVELASIHHLLISLLGLVVARAVQLSDGKISMLATQLQ